MNGILYLCLFNHQRDTRPGADEFEITYMLESFQAAHSAYDGRKTTIAVDAP